MTLLIVDDIYLMFFLFFFTQLTVIYRFYFLSSYNYGKDETRGGKGDNEKESHHRA